MMRCARRQRQWRRRQGDPSPASRRRLDGRMAQARWIREGMIREGKALQRRLFLAGAREAAFRGAWRRPSRWAAWCPPSLLPERVPPVRGDEAAS